MSLAHFSRDRKYRYVLYRELEKNITAKNFKPVAFIMLNPSTADEYRNDPTIRRCISFARNNGYNFLAILNLFALRSSNPRVLEKNLNPIGIKNNYWVSRVVSTILEHNGAILVAWGANKLARERAKELLSKLGKVFCLGVNKDGSPKHPLYVPMTQKFVKFENISGWTKRRKVSV